MLLEKEQLIFDEKLHRYSVGGVVIPSVTQILTDVGIIDTRWFNEEACIRGSYVHEATILIDKGNLDESNLDPILKPYCDAYRLFIQESGFDVMRSEKMEYSKNYRFAGTYDRLGILNDDLTLIDLKTGSMPSWAGVQLAGYDILLDGSCFKPSRRFGVHLKSNGKYSLHEYKDRTDRSVFLSAVNLYHFKHK